MCPKCNKLSASLHHCTNDICRYQTGYIGDDPIKFEVLSVEQQLQLLFRRYDFYEAVTRTTFDNDPSDITVSKEYSKRITRERLMNPNIIRITFQFHCDGIKVYAQNNNLSVWPLYFVVNEIPLRTRFSYENMLLYTCWPAHTKIDRKRMVSLLEHMAEIMSPLENGIKLMNPYNEEVEV
ncbi:unnamed protein product [Didymodactylos carnosus]|uniref:Uncharacterized protein n=1 Tax=Didymodactylos carnosus TaxID=1234261 RepID=A0A8S2F605_9BILA|nr:unnamed protein product [Didymodactylos carnosus]CAF4149253.1 unnamed protein product [Didymodactylos carnosus]